MPRSKLVPPQVPIEQCTVMTQREVARVLGISQMRVCQIEKTALAKLRLAFLRLGICCSETPYMRRRARH